MLTKPMVELIAEDWPGLAASLIAFTARWHGIESGANCAIALGVAAGRTLPRGRSVTREPTSTRISSTATPIASNPIKRGYVRAAPDEAGRPRMGAPSDAGGSPRAPRGRSRNSSSRIGAHLRDIDAQADQRTVHAGLGRGPADSEHRPHLFEGQVHVVAQDDREPHVVGQPAD